MGKINQRVFAKTIPYFLQPVAAALEDDEVREIMINGFDEVFVERRGLLEKRPDLCFPNEQSLMSAVRNIAQAAGFTLNMESPRFDATIPPGHRVHVILSPLCSCGISVTIRKHSGDPLKLKNLIDMGTVSQEAADDLKRLVRANKNIMVSGGTGTGKTTLLNVLSSFIPDGQRIIVIEDTAELKLQQNHVIYLKSRPPDRKGRGEVTIRHLLHSSLRMRPDRIVIGECRGGEALDLLQALNTGHGGSMSTVHANAPREALERLETLALFGFGGQDYPISFLRAQVLSAIDIVIQIQRWGDRRLVERVAANRRATGQSQYALVDLYRLDVTGMPPLLKATAEGHDYLKNLH